MGTRARVNIIEDGKPLVSIYRQFDGYPGGLGAEIAEFCANMRIINGIGNETAGTAANGMGCFAAQLIAKLKKEIGNVYIRDTSNESHGEEFSYDVYEKDGTLHIKVLSGSMTAFGCPGTLPSNMKTIFDGTAKEFLEFALVN